MKSFRPSFRRFLVFCCGFGLSALGPRAHAQTPDQEVARPLFRASFDATTTADMSAGEGKPTTVGTPELAGGVRGKAVLVGKDDYLAYSLKDNLDAVQGSLAFWAKPVGWSGNDEKFHYFVSMPGPQQWMMIQTVEGTAAFLGGSRTAFTRSGTSIADWRDGEWRQVVVTWKGDQGRLYLDGKPAPPVTWPVVPTDLGDSLLVGGQLFGTAPGRTAIDELTIYGRALAPELVAELYRADVAASPVLAKTGTPTAPTMPRIEPTNLVKPELGAIVLPSSQSAAPEDAVENVFDANFDTKWVSASGTFPNWLEVRWPQPITAHALVIQEYRQTQTARYRIEAYQAGKWKEVVAPTPNAGPPGTPLRIEFAPLRTTRLRYTMLSPTGEAQKASSFVSELQVLGTSDQAQALARMSPPAWGSQWIWYPEPDVSNVARFFRRHFSVADPAAVRQAWLQIGADDAYEVYLNGHKVGSGNIPTQLYEVTRWLQRGDNVLAVKSQEYDLFEGVIAELALNTARTTTRIVSDRSWKAFDHEVQGWQSNDFDDAAWKSAQERGIPPHSQHPDQKYFNVTPKETFVLKGVRAAPLAARPGKQVHIEVQLAAPQGVQHDYAFVLRLGDAPLTQYGDFTVATKAFLPPTPTSRWKKGQAYSLALDVTLPEWAPDGEIPIFLTPVGRGVAAQVGTSGSAVGRLRIQRFATAPKPWPATPPRAQVVERDGRPVLTVNGKVVPPYIQTVEGYSSYQAMGEYARTDNHLWRLWAQKGLHSPYVVDDPAKENAAFFPVVDQIITNLLKVDPNAYIIFGTQLTMPKAWTDKYPDDAALLANGERVQFSLSSRRWLARTQDDLRALVRHLQSQPYSGHVIGLHFDLAGETYYWGYTANAPGTPRDQLLLGDYSPEHLRAFRVWLRERYGDDVNALRAAWQDKTVNFETASPDLKVLQLEDVGNFRNPARTRMAFDYWEFHADVMAARVNDIARTIKAASGSKFITGFWGLYSNGFNAATGNPGKLQQVAYAGLQKVLRSPWVDYVANLQAYAHVRWGTPMVPTNLTGSIRAHGKLALVEYDMRTFFTPLVFSERTYSQAESLAVMQRDTAAAALHGDMLWWVGFGEGTQGRASVPWYDDDSLLDALRQNNRVYQATAGANSTSAAEVAVFVNNADVYGLDALTAHSVLSSAQYNPIYFEFPKLGAPSDFYELEDIARPEMARYKVFVFLNAYNVSPALRESIKARVRVAGKTAVWLYAPGFSDGKQLSTDLIRDLTGFSVAYDTQALTPVVTLDAKHALTQGLPADYTLQPRPWEHDSGPFRIGPIFNVTDADATPLGHYTQGGKVACALKTVDGANSIYLAIPAIDAAFLRSICQFSGVHLYTAQPTYLDASHDFLTLTAQADGLEQTVKLPHAATVYDIFAHRVLARNATEFRAQIAPLKTGFYFVGDEAGVARLEKALHDPGRAP